MKDREGLEICCLYWPRWSGKPLQYCRRPVSDSCLYKWYLSKDNVCWQNLPTLPANNTVIMTSQCRMKLQMTKLAAWHGSPILLDDFIGHLNHACPQKLADSNDHYYDIRLSPSNKWQRAQMQTTTYALCRDWRWSESSVPSNDDSVVNWLNDIGMPENCRTL